MALVVVKAFCHHSTLLVAAALLRMTRSVSTPANPPQSPWIKMHIILCYAAFYPHIHIWLSGAGQGKWSHAAECFMFKREHWEGAAYGTRPNSSQAASTEITNWFMGLYSFGNADGLIHCTWKGLQKWVWVETEFTGVMDILTLGLLIHHDMMKPALQERMYLLAALHIQSLHRTDTDSHVFFLIGAEKNALDGVTAKVSIMWITKDHTVFT